MLLPHQLPLLGILHYLPLPGIARIQHYTELQYRITDAHFQTYLYEIVHYPQPPCGARLRAPDRPDFSPVRSNARVEHSSGATCLPMTMLLLSNSCQRQTISRMRHPTDLAMLKTAFMVAFHGFWGNFLVTCCC